MKNLETLTTEDQALIECPSTRLGMVITSMIEDARHRHAVEFARNIWNHAKPNVALVKSQVAQEYRP